MGDINLVSDTGVGDLAAFLYPRYRQPQIPTESSFVDHWGGLKTNIDAASKEDFQISKQGGHICVKPKRQTFPILLGGPN